LVSLLYALIKVESENNSKKKMDIKGDREEKFDFLDFIEKIGEEKYYPVIIII